MGVEKRLQETWYGERRPGMLLSALERVYAGISTARRERATPAEDLVGRPIIVVGNITAGGTGKTPLVIQLCELLKGQGRRVAVVSRGYGRRSTGPVTVTAETPAVDGGDEPVLIARRCGVPVYVDADREAAARSAFDNGADMVLTDDGLQRASLPRIMEFCVVDAARGFGNGRLLPAGPLREPIERLERVDWIVLNGAGHSATDKQGRGDELQEILAKTAQQAPLAMTLQPTAFLQLDGEERLGIDEALERFGKDLTAIAGLGNPARFFNTLESLGFSGFRRQPFPDHHQYVAADFDALEGTLLMTEKDAVKCAGLGLENAWYLEVEARLPPDFADNWFKQLRDRTKESS